MVLCILVLFNRCVEPTKSVSTDVGYQTYLDSGDWNRALTMVQKRLENSSGSLSSNESVLLMTISGTLMWKHGQTKEAIMLLKNTLELAIEHELIQHYGEICYNLGEAYYIQNYVMGIQRFDTMMQYHKLALDWRRKNSDLKGVSHSLSRLGVIYERQNLTDSAIVFYHEAISISDSIGYAIGKSRPYTHLGVYYVGKEDTIRARDFFERAYTISSENNNHEALPFNIVNLVNISKTTLQNIDSLESQLKMAFDISTKTQFKLAMVNTLFNLGRFYEKTNQPEKSINYFEKTKKEAMKYNYRIYETIASRRLESINH